jgi:hypothetical protein
MLAQWALQHHRCSMLAPPALDPSPTDSPSQASGHTAGPIVCPQFFQTVLPAALACSCAPVYSQVPAVSTQCGSSGSVVAVWWQCGGSVMVQCDGSVVAVWWQCGGSVVAVWWQCGGSVVAVRTTLMAAP